jgi:hypothetical protein
LRVRERVLVLKDGKKGTRPSYRERKALGGGLREALDSVLLYTINEAREKLGEARVDDPEAGKLLVLTEKAGWLHQDNRPVNVTVEALLPKAIARLTTVADESKRST